MTDVSKRALWAAYVRRITGSLKQREIQQRIDYSLGELGAGPSQVTISRWLSGSKAPDSAVSAADFARAFGRNPLEAFVAASMLSEDEAGRGLDDESRTLLAELKGRRPRSGRQSSAG